MISSSPACSPAPLAAVSVPDAAVSPPNAAAAVRALRAIAQTTDAFFIDLSPRLKVLGVT
jgi:hypothetical protein